MTFVGVGVVLSVPEVVLDVVDLEDTLDVVDVIRVEGL